MLERYFLRPATVDRIRANVAGAYIEHYVEWLQAQGYADRNVFRRVPILCQFGEFASARGAIDGSRNSSLILCMAIRSAGIPFPEKNPEG